MATYWHQHSRGFANECSIYRADNETQEQDLMAAGYSNLTRREMADHVRWLNGENDAWGSNRAYGRISLKAVTESNEYSAAHLDVYA